MATSNHPNQNQGPSQGTNPQGSSSQGPKSPQSKKMSDSNWKTSSA